MGYCPRCFASIDANDAKCPYDGASARLAANPDKLIGAVVLSARLVRRIGEGISGAVYLAEGGKTGAPCAIKVIRSEWLAHPHLIERFQSEARILASIEHPNIVKVLAVGTLAESGVPGDRRLFVQMEYVQGTTLADRLKERTRLPMTEAIPIARQICRAMEAAHARGVVHGDLRPRNVFLTGNAAEPRVKLLGFGSGQTVVEGDATEIDVRIGVADYLSPEQLKGGMTAVTPASDLFSLGVILFEMAAGRTPDPRRDVDWRPAPRQLLEGVVTRPDEYVTPAYEAVILRCLSIEPGKRHSSAHSLSLVLEAASEAPVAPARQRDRDYGLLVAAGAGVTVLIVALLFTIRPKGEGHQPRATQTGLSAPSSEAEAATPSASAQDDDDEVSHLHARATMPWVFRQRPARKHEPPAPLPDPDEFALPDAPVAKPVVPEACLQAEASDAKPHDPCTARKAKWTACLAAIATPGNEVPGLVKARYEKREASLQIVCQLDSFAFAPDCKAKAKKLEAEAHAKGLFDAESAAADALKGCP